MYLIAAFTSYKEDAYEKTETKDFHFYADLVRHILWIRSCNLLLIKHMNMNV